MPVAVLSLLAKRFVAGETAAQGVVAARQLNQRGMGAILDFLGEDVSSAEAAKAARMEYLQLLSKIQMENVDSAVSLKASQMGLLISRELCLENIQRVVEEAGKMQKFVWMDMEGSALTQNTVDVFAALSDRFQNLGLCLQAYLIRTGGDLDRFMRRPVTIRLCKGAYKEPASVAFTDRRAVEANFRMLTQKLFDATGRGVYPAFATHDEGLIDFVRKTATERKILKEKFEFQMLYGINNGLLESLAKEGYRTRVYIPYGTAWFPYFVRRLRERKENVYFLMRNLFKM